MKLSTVLQQAEQNTALKFAHESFTKHESISFPNTQTVRFEDGFEVSIVDFFTPRKGQQWQQGWSVL